MKPWTGSDEFAAIKAAIDARATVAPVLLPADQNTPPPEEGTEETITPPGWRGNPDPAVVHDAPLLPANENRIVVPVGVSKQDPGTPTPLALSGPVLVSEVLPVM